MPVAVSQDLSLESTLFGPGLERAWRESLAEDRAVTSGEQEEWYTQVVALRDQFAVVLRSVPGSLEKRAALALFYGQVKSQWLLLRTQIGYQIADDKSDTGALARVKLLGILLKTVEACLASADQERVIASYSRPIPNTKISRDTQASDDLRLCRDDRSGSEPGLEKVGMSEEYISALANEVNQLRADRDVLLRELGQCEPDALIALFRGMRESGDHPPVSALVKPDSSQIFDDGETAELVNLRADREVLVKRLGTGDVPTVVARFQELDAALITLTTRLGRYEADRFLLQEELGRCEAREVVAFFREHETRAVAI